ncbi:MAG: J domain-containing protein, partial [Planctomycetes bacterium]|nr:J domain-containing protein [Planctomycetota bacterium]
PFAISVTGGTVPITLERSNGATETLEVKIPAGIEDGKKIRLRGQGEAGPDGATAGDLIIMIHVDSHPWFQRRGKNLHVRVPVTLAEAALGGKVEVPSPHGSVVLRLPSGTSSGAKLRVRGHGVKPAGTTPGDLYAEIQIQLPQELTDEEREQIRQLDARHPLNPRRDLRW